KALAKATSIMEDYLTAEGEQKAGSKWGNVRERNPTPAQGRARAIMTYSIGWSRNHKTKEDLLPWAGHMGREKTLQQVTQRFFCLGIHQEVRDYCTLCPECQKASPKGVPKAPLVPLPMIEMPFECIGLDLVGPLEKSSSSHKYILVVVNYATWYPEVVPLQTAMTSVIANEHVLYSVKHTLEAFVELIFILITMFLCQSTAL
uniref:Gypsy retrotransposon integrase-like protein 1 n=1 Tax=Chelonoidis abingdonii TaxID=106734 RepID=A0A8C0J3Q8_CHEAB